MQKRIIYLSLLFFAAVLGTNAQTVQLKWTGLTTVLDSNFNPKKTLYFEGAKTHKDLLPYYELNLANTAATNFKLTNTQYLPLSEEEATVMQNKTIPSVFVRIGVQNRQPLTTILLVPLRKNSQSGAYEKLVSFEYEYERTDFVVPAAAPKKTTASKTFANAKTMAAGASVLSSGSWYRLAVGSTGIFKIDYNFLKSMGLNPDGIDPRYIRLFGNGGGMLPQANNVSRADDLLENTIYVSGEGDGNFGPGDYILFYAKGPDSWSYNTLENIFNHSKNIYSDKSCYFLTIGPAMGARVQAQADLGAGVSVSYFDDYVFYENDFYNLLGSGREWYGETFSDAPSKTFSFNSAGIVPGSDIILTSSVMSRSISTTSFSVSINGSGLSPLQSIGPNSGYNGYEYDAKGLLNRTVFPPLSSSVIGNPSTLNVTLTYNQGSSSTSVGHLDYLELNFRRSLALYGTQTSFRTRASTANAATTYNVGNATGATIWQVTDLTDIRNQLYSLAGSTAVFSANSVALEEYVVFSGSDFPSPEFVGGVGNQNLHGINAPNLPDMVIVTHPDFAAQANQLANYRQSNDGLSVVVVTTQQVYNEFSSGAQDITAIRDFMKMLFDRKSGSDSLRYLLLFGDCSYDYKSRISGNTNYVPVYQSYQSVFPLSSFSSDDYFGLLDNTDGDWDEGAADERIDIGIGRIPARSVEEASTAVDKLIHYSGSQSCLGKWRNNITFVSDDGNGNTHINDANRMAMFVDTTYKVYNINKVFLDAFVQSASPGGEKAPEVNTRIEQDVNKGTFILNYSGHGSETVWTQENILDISQIENWDNYNNMPFMITATCDFGRYDDPFRASGAEVALMRAGGGAIGLITSTRVVFAYSNYDLNRAVYDYIFKPLTDGKKPRLGDVVRQSKNSSVLGVNNRNFALLGDPSLRLAYPSENVAITQIKGNAVSSVPDTLKALSKVTIQGEVRNTLGAKLTGFNGKLNITVYDKKTAVTTYGTEGDAVYPFTLRNNFLFDGNASVINGDWSVSFVVPKDISYQYDFGKISVYAEKDGSLQDAGGFYTNVIIGGTDLNAPADNLPPRIRLFMNDESFVFGGLTENNALFLANLSDENGINTAGSGIGHEIAVTLDDNEKPIVLNQFYTANLNDYKNGTVKYPFKDLEAGPHTLKLKAWDTYNNSAESYLEFIVANNERIALSHILNYPNPFSTHTIFHFDHNRSGEELDVMIQVYTVSGKLVKTLDTKVYSSGSHFSGLDWDGKDDFGDKIGKGVYVYRVWVRAPRDGSSVHKYEKLVLLN